MNIFETLKKLSESKRKDPSYIYLEDNQIKERKLSELLDSAGSGLINRTVYKSPLKLIRDSIFGKDLNDRYQMKTKAIEKNQDTGQTEVFVSLSNQEIIFLKEVVKMSRIESY